MYAVGLTSHNLISLSDSATNKVESKINAYKGKPFKNGAAYCTVIKNETWSFFKDYDGAKSYQLILHIFGQS